MAGDFKRSLAKMMGLDLYVEATSDDQLIQLTKNISSNTDFIHPLMCWDIASLHSVGVNMSTNENDLNSLQALTAKFGWATDFTFIKNEQSEAIVVTDATQTILWVNEGFTTMTGYEPSFAIGKKPKFLQGAETSSESRERIRNKLSSGIPFSDVVINYKKDKSPYKCLLKIYPIRNHQNEITAFMALERQVA
ncbi:MAG: PAS domain-containing protein [Chitinophagales bacterium]|nr:PAS domain-containing protein [Chitinophagales bacterium]